MNRYTTPADGRQSVPPALSKHPVSVEQIDTAVERIDNVAYVRFASVYRSFEDVDEFRQLIRDI